MNEQTIAVAGQRGTTGADMVRGEVLARVALGHSKRINETMPGVVGVSSP